MTFKEFREMIESEISNKYIPVRFQDYTGHVYHLALRLNITNTNKGYLSVGIAYTKSDLTGNDILNILSEFEHAVSSLNPNRNNIEDWQVSKTLCSSITKIKLVTDRYNEKFFVI